MTKTQDPFVYQTLLKNVMAPITPNAQYIDEYSDWDDKKALYDLLLKRYTKKPNTENALLWRAYVNSFRAIDCHEFLQFFKTCPLEHQSKEQKEITQGPVSNDAHRASLQLLCNAPNSALWCQAFQVPDVLVHMEVHDAMHQLQCAWYSNDEHLIHHHLIDRTKEFYQKTSMAIALDMLPTTGVGLLLALNNANDIEGMTVSDFGDFEKHYKTSCGKATLKDTFQLIDLLLLNPELYEPDEDGIFWYTPFMDETHPMQEGFNFCQAMDPEMDLQWLKHTLTAYYAPQEKYPSLDYMQHC